MLHVSLAHGQYQHWCTSPGLTATEDPLCKFDGAIYHSIDILFSEAAAILDLALDDFYSITSNTIPSPAMDCIDFVEASVMPSPITESSLSTELSLVPGFHLIHLLLVSPKVKLSSKECSIPVHGKTLNVIASTDVSLLPFDHGPTLTLTSPGIESRLIQVHGKAHDVIVSMDVSLLPFDHGPTLTLTSRAPQDECPIANLSVITSTHVSLLPFDCGLTMTLDTLLDGCFINTLDIVASTNVGLLPFD